MDSKSEKTKKMSEVWKMANSKTKCLICGSTKNVVKHHINYENGDIVYLCQSCHIKIHKNQNFKKFYAKLVPDELKWSWKLEYKKYFLANEIVMFTKLYPDGKILIPAEIRKTLGFKTGQKFHIKVDKNGVIHLYPLCIKS
jgi:AbrB family looped-hinge helix DNA binding protein